MGAATGGDDELWSMPTTSRLVRAALTTVTGRPGATDSHELTVSSPSVDELSSR